MLRVERQAGFGRSTRQLKIAEPFALNPQLSTLNFSQPRTTPCALDHHAYSLPPHTNGQMPERSNGLAWKAGMRQKRIEGSNPSLSALCKSKSYNTDRQKSQHGFQQVKEVREVFVSWQAMTMRSPILLTDARRAIHFSTADDSRSREAILFSIFAVEAFINDLSMMLGELAAINLPEPMAMLADALPELEESKVQLKLKVRLVYFILTGQRLDRGAEPFQSFSLLVDIRNKLVHNRGSFIQSTSQPVRESDRNFRARLVQTGAASEHWVESKGDWEAPLWKIEAGVWALSTSQKNPACSRDGTSFRVVS
jgi:hypothetical protein